MSYTIREILSHPLMNKINILSGQAVILTQPVGSISVIEIPVEQFVRRNEFVLSTAMGCQEDEELFLSFVKDIMESGAAALAIAVGRHVQQIPAKVLEFARLHDFPLIELPWELRFSDMIEFVMRGIHDWEQASWQTYEQLQKQILQLYLSGRDIADTLKVMAETFNARIWLLQKRAIYTAQEQDAEWLYQFANQSEPSYHRTDRDTLVQLFPFRIFNQEPAVLVLETSDVSQQPIPAAILEQTVLGLNLWFKKDVVFLEKEKRRKAEFLKMLIKGDWQDLEKIQVQASQYGMMKAEAYVCLTAFPEADGREGKWLANNHYIEDIAAVCAMKLHLKHFCTMDEEYLVVFLKAEEDGLPDIGLYMDRLDKELHAAEFPILSWGINDTAADLSLFPTAYELAKAALKIGLRQKGPGHRSMYSHTVIYRVISQMAQDGAMNELMQATMEPLLAYSQNHSLDLIQTLTCFINCNRNVSQTARALSLQRQSLLYRIQKIETLTQRSLSNPDDLFVLQLCLKVLNR